MLEQGAMLESGAYVLVGTVGRFAELLRARPNFTMLQRLRYLILDEVDMFTTGAAHLDKDMQYILSRCQPALPDRNTFIATASPTVELRGLLSDGRF